MSIETHVPRSPLKAPPLGGARVDSGVGRDPSKGSPDGAKSVGAYYTPAPVARALTEWAVRRPGDGVLDPAAGDGVFLVEAAARLRGLGCAAPTVTGVELRPAAAREARERLAAADAGPRARVRVGDFLALEPGRLPPFAAVVGNPPYVRFQRLDGTHRRRAAAIAAAAGLRADPLASSWTAFVAHAERFLGAGGRLALVLPSEIGHARYARSVLALLRQRFGRVRFVLFESALFPSLDQGAVLLLAEGHEEPFQGFSVARLASGAALANGLCELPTHPLDAEALLSGEARLHHVWLPEPARALLDALRARGACTPLGAWASVSIGYVTGANDFFHLSPDQARTLGIDARHLRPALFRARALRGLAVTADDWLHGAEHGHSGYLLLPEDAGDLALGAYLSGAGPAGVRGRAKVRGRTPWYRVTRAAPPDLALTAMSAVAPRLAVNATGAAVSNTLHAVRLEPAAQVPPWLLALAAITSLAELSAELEGHALGGGMLKLEPSEATRLLLPLPAPARDAGAGVRDAARLAEAFDAADRALRAGDRDAARDAADRALLERVAGLSVGDVATLRAAADRLRALRRGLRRPMLSTGASPAGDARHPRAD
ncbi:MAG TPA: N-6 DNA methylase [Trueperaceae bacterium]|nr:N-6 DNA methylase [Trueperaceae bacterium]